MLGTPTSTFGGVIGFLPEATTLWKLFSKAVVGPREKRVKERGEKRELVYVCAHARVKF